MRWCCSSLLIVAVAAAACRSRAEDRVVALGRGAVSTAATLSVVAVTTASETMGYHQEQVSAGPGHKYVLLDCRFAVAPSQVDFDDFQLVRDSSRVGEETNVGDHDDRDYFFWTFLDSGGRPVARLSDSTASFVARLAFKVPSDAQRGYLSYWGLYWGPLRFDRAGQHGAGDGG